MLICVAGKIFSFKNEFAYELCKKLGYELILYKNDHLIIDGYQNIPIVKVKDRAAADDYAMAHNSKVQVLIIREASDWNFLDQRSCRTLVYIETPSHVRLERAFSLEKNEICKKIANEFPGDIYKLIHEQLNEILAFSEDANYWWPLLDDFFNFNFKEKIYNLFKEATARGKNVFELTELDDVQESFSYMDKKEVTHNDLKHNTCTIVYAFNEADLQKEIVSDLSSKFRYTRESWDDYFLKLVKIVSKRSTCIKRSGCIVVDGENRIIATGHSGTPTKAKNCIEGGCHKCTSYYATCYTQDSCYCIHAVQNAFLYIGRRFLDNKCTAYCLSYPCISCSKVIAQCKIERVVYCTPPPECAFLKNTVLESAGIKFEYINTLPVRYLWAGEN